MPTLQEEFVTFFKAMADANRLKIVGLLAQEPMSVEALAAALSLSSSTVSHHLARLSEVGLVSARPKGYYNIYQFEADALETMARRLLSQELLDVTTGPDTEEEKTLAAFLAPDGRLRTIPVSQKKKMVVLAHILGAFEPGRLYTEKEVNEIMRRFHEDTASLRRAMIDFRLMAREGGMYWRLDGEA